MALVRATGGIVTTVDPAATDTATIGSQVYTFIASPASAGDVDVGATRLESMQNLAAAINGGAGAGTAYDAATVEHPLVRAEVVDAQNITLIAKIPGSLGNHIPIATSETDFDILNDESFLTGGSGDFQAELLGMQLNSEVLAVFQDLIRAASD